LFRKTSATFDEGGARGLLLNNLFVYDGCNIAFDSTDAILDSGDLYVPISITSAFASSMFICCVCVYFRWLQREKQHAAKLPPKEREELKKHLEKQV
jgi:hypothetical protein